MRLEASAMRSNAEPGAAANRHRSPVAGRPGRRPSAAPQARKPSASNRPCRVVPKTRRHASRARHRRPPPARSARRRAADAPVVDAVARDPLPGARAVDRRRRGRSSTLSASKRVASGSHPRPVVAPADPRRRPGRRCARPAICAPAQIATTAARADGARTASARPAARSQARSARVAFDPGSTTRCGPAQLGRRSHPAHRDRGSSRSGSRSPKFATCGSRTRRRRARRRDRAPDAGSLAATGRGRGSPRRRGRCPSSIGTTPSVGTPQRRSSSAQASPSRAGSPRNLLITKPRTQRRRSSGSSATVP